ncbi:OmpH family outer membrane protein [Cytophagaceae bacterium YF14B1]|uniref:OmpH family outer membrane protein n=1 Tax=Xanthocytophaga flava TaxID=3048013 RepID=A0AAE3QV98_9BACT|nr:OmpH family outer membrane protein [Xanthocytophaga flavus]MDJ1486052.1 OmpH family outer membrane protein [Xanthocytophaga flavus]
MNKNLLSGIAIGLVLNLLVLGIYHFSFKEKIAYVKTGVILEKYSGMKQANDQFQQELKSVQQTADTLRARYETLKNANQKTADWGYKLGVAERDFQQYSQNAQQQLQQKQQQLTADVLDRVNSFIENYGKKNGYKIILGTTQDGSLLYGEPGADLTDQILSELNSSTDKSSSAKK